VCGLPVLDGSLTGNYDLLVVPQMPPKARQSPTFNLPNSSSRYFSPNPENTARKPHLPSQVKNRLFSRLKSIFHSGQSFISANLSLPVDYHDQGTFQSDALSAHLNTNLAHSDSSLFGEIMFLF
jgi:hypothetical protein